MNRKERRAAGKSGQPEGNPQLALAIQHHQRGALREAERLYNQILEADPKNADALHLLGVAAMQTGQPGRAIELIGRSLAINGRNPQSHYNIALAHAALKQWPEVETHSRRAIAFNPDNADAYLNLGNALHARGNSRDAIVSYRNGLARNASHAQLHRNLANVLAETGARTDAIVHYEKALSLDPSLTDLHNNLGTLLMAEDRPDDALAHYRRAAAGRSASAEAHNNIGALLMLRNEFEEALSHFVQAIRAQPTLSGAYRNAARAVVMCKDDPAILAPASEYILRAIADRADDDIYLTAAAIKALRNTPAVAALMHGDAQLDAAQIRVLAGNALLVAAMAAAPLRDLQFEALLTRARTHLLEAALLTGPASGEDLTFFCALAQQCFLNEYVYAVSAGEEEQFSRLRASVEAELVSGAPDVLKIAALGAYQSLSELSEAENLLRHPWPAPMEALLTQQVREPLEERRLRAAMPRLTAIDDAISAAVRDQYEENPYPRWTVSKARGERARDFDRFMREEYPAAQIRPLGKTEGIDYLMAGCGTGLQLIGVARTFSGLNVTAVDLSLASLAYARRSIESVGIAGITFGQADILKLEGLGKTFDVVDSAGVLHHMADPEAGWRVLVSLLRPGGLMRIGLYSTIAREDAAVTRARRFVVERGFGRDAASIRRARQEIIALPASDPIKAVSGIVDFHSMSDCRDLLFHVQEHTFDLPRIDRFLRANGLRFVTFDVDPRVLRDFDALFPAPGARADLDCWHRFEQQHPKTFIGMYQFWVQKPA